MTPAPALPPARPHRYWEDLPEVVEVPHACRSCGGEASVEVLAYGWDSPGYELEPCPTCRASGIGLDVDWGTA